VNEDPAYARLAVRLTPRSVKDEIGGWTGGVLQARVRAAPVDGKANEALCGLIAKALGVAPGRVAVVAGHAARMKRLRIEGLSQGEVSRRLARG